MALALLQADAVRRGASSAAEGPTWESLGLVLCVVGCFLLANGVLLRDLRAVVAERLAHARPLRSLRDLLFHRLQTALGFVFLTGGFVLQLLGRALTSPDGGDLPGSIALWTGGIVVLAILLEGLGWWWSLHGFRRHLGAFLREHPPDLASDLQLARELGELFGVRSHAEDTVPAFLDRLRRELDLPRPPRPRPRDEAGVQDFPERGEATPSRPQPPGRGLTRRP